MVKVDRHFNKIVSVNEFYRPTLDEVSEVFCEVCGSACEVQREHTKTIPGCKNIALDYFYCPHNNKDWHVEALGMTEEIKETHSPSIKEMIRKDIADVIFKNLNRVILNVEKKD